MKPPYEELSRLLAGELSDSEARALQERIRTEPAVARAYAALEELASGLSALPEEAPPPALDARVLGAAPPVPRRPPIWIGALAALAASALITVAGWRGEAPAPTIVLSHGDQRVEGAALVVAGEVPITVDGVARIQVEPTPPLVRVPLSSEDEMKGAAIGVGGMMAGALVTVGVMEGTAEIGGSEPVTLSAGQSTSFRGKAAAPPDAARPAPTAPLAERLAWLEQENERLSHELEQARFEGALARGQVAQAQGVPSEWPDQVPEGFGAAEFEANLRAAASKIEGISVVEVDCSEYPCLATFVSELPEADLQLRMRDLTTALADGRDQSVWLGMSRNERGGDAHTAIGLGILPPGTEADVALQTRTDFRAKTLLEELAAR